MDFISSVINKAKSNLKTIVLPETEDHRILKASAIINEQKIANLILIGNEKLLLERGKNIGVNLAGIKFIDPLQSEFLDEFVKKYTKKREKKGMTEIKAKEILTTQFIFFGAMLVDKGIAHGMVAGAVNSTGNTLRSIFHCVGSKEGVNTVSSFFIIIAPKKEFGEDGILFFADCAVVPNPTDMQLAEIAEATADNFKIFIGKEPKLAFLSFSTKGSADTLETRKIVSAYKILMQKRKDIMCDGELQLDAAIIPSVGKKKAPNSKIAGQANILIFPDLNSGNIGYKLIQRLGEAEAIGPILQGAKKPINDLSRGCDVEDIVNVVAMTALQSC
ncbi:MAG: phosphate acetyltransferase [Spirochaetes bacterium]|nr:phosphate acetyltransferase [Spirochaetota bacterium]